MNHSARNVTASVIIATRNRRDELLRAVESCFAQSFRELEVLVFDDGSEDGSSGYIRERWPEVVVVENDIRVGYIVNRNRGFKLSRGRIIFSIDDDAYFADPDVVSETVRLFEQDVTIGAVAIPYVEPRNRRSVSSLRSSFTAKRGEDVKGYIGCAHAVRRDVALELQGYREFFIHQGEERDFCIRLREGGYRIVYGNSGHVVHMVSPNRESDRVSFYGIRNRILFDWLNVPLPQVLVRMMWDPLAMIRYRFAWKDLPVKLRAVAAGYAEVVHRRKERKAVSRKTYRDYVRLPGHVPEYLIDVPPPCRLVETGISVSGQAHGGK